MTIPIVGGKMYITMNTQSELFGQRLLSEREKRGFSQSGLAREARITKGAVSNYEAGKVENPDPKVLRAIAFVLQVSDEEIYRWAGLLSPKSDYNPRFEEMKHLLEQLPEDEQDELIALARLKVDRFSR